MKIYYISGNDIPSKSASTVHVMRVCSALAALGHEVTLFASMPDSRREDPFHFYGLSNNFKIVRFKKCVLPVGGGFCFAAKFWMYARRHRKPELFYGRHCYSLLAASWFSLPTSLEVHQPPESKSVWLSQKLLFKSPPFKGLVCITKALAKDYLLTFPELEKANIIIAPDAADPSENCAPIKPWPGRKNALQVGYVGHLYPGKGMEIIAELCPKMPDIDFHIIGGREEDITYWQSIISTANIFFHGFVRNTDLSAYYYHFDTALAPIQSQVLLPDKDRDIGKWTSPLKIFEYMAYRLPILASDIPVLHEVLEHEHNALLLPSEDVDAWVGALRRLEEDSDLKQRLGEAAYKDFETRHNWKDRCKYILSELFGYR